VRAIARRAAGGTHGETGMTRHGGLVVMAAVGLLAACGADDARVAADPSDLGIFFPDGTGAGEVLAPEVDTSAPDVDTSMVELDTSGPEPDTTTPEPDTTTPELDTAMPELDTTTPELDATTPELDTAMPELDAATPELDTATPEVDTSGPEDSAAPEVDTSATSCQTGGCETDVATVGNTCATAYIIGRPNAQTGFGHAGTTAGAGNDSDFPQAVCGDSQSDRFYQIYLKVSEQLTVNANPQPASFDLTFGLYRGQACETPITCVDSDANGMTPDRMLYQATVEGWHTLVVDGRNTEGDYTLVVTLDCFEDDCCCR